jgi:hypothetical protein
VIFVYLGFINFPIGIVLGIWYKSLEVVGICTAGLLVTGVLWYTDRRTGWIRSSEE